MGKGADIVTKVWPQWEIVETIGKGAFGSVYKVRKKAEKEWDHTFYRAVKVIHIPNEEVGTDSMTASGMTAKDIRNYFGAITEELMTEIKAMDRLKSAGNIVGIEDSAVIEDEKGIGWTIYIRMELLQSMEKYLSKNGMAVEKTVKLGIDICKALEICHSEHIIHRDIKPSNIFVSEYGEFKLGDFGISRKMEASNVTLSSKGTTTYMAPEMIRMEKYGINVDIYALGITMYEFLNNGRMPFLPDAPTPFYPKDRENALARRHSGEKLPLPAQADEELGRIVCKACEADPKRRYQSAMQMKKELQNWMMGGKEQEDRTGDGVEFVDTGDRTIDKWNQKKQEQKEQPPQGNWIESGSEKTRGGTSPDTQKKNAGTKLTKKQLVKIVCMMVLGTLAGRMVGWGIGTLMPYHGSSNAQKETDGTDSPAGQDDVSPDIDAAKADGADSLTGQDDVSPDIDAAKADGADSLTGQDENRTVQNSESDSDNTIELSDDDAVVAYAISSVILVGDTVPSIVRAGNWGLSSGNDIKWKSNDESVAIVSEDGLVTGVSPGTVAISAQFKDRTSEFNVHVVAIDGSSHAAVKADYQSISLNPGASSTVNLTLSGNVPEHFNLTAYSSTQNLTLEWGEQDGYNVSLTVTNKGYGQSDGTDAVITVLVYGMDDPDHIVAAERIHANITG